MRWLKELEMYNQVETKFFWIPHFLNLNLTIFHNFWRSFPQGINLKNVTNDSTYEGTTKGPTTSLSLVVILLAIKLTWLHHMRGLLIILKNRNGLGQSGGPIPTHSWAFDLHGKDSHMRELRADWGMTLKGHGQPLKGFGLSSV